MKKTGRRNIPNLMLASIGRIKFAHNFFVNVSLIFYPCFQIFESCHIFEEFIVDLHYDFASILVTIREHVIYTMICAFRAKNHQC
jgi:hypothetical protein